ncbi:MAG TPA: serine/threonine-protein kinase [Polyangiaceae bacterium]|nr:serine/threonine-protein kinase [Polyangiaceae bacterium]
MRHQSVPPAGLPAGIPVPGSRVAGKYLIEGVLARGGMGVVLAAQHETLQQRVAIKVLLPEVARDRVSAERFAREARAIAQLYCDNVVRVMDVGTLPNGLPFMVMEHLTGFDLAEQLRRSGPLSVAEAVDVVLQSCVAVAEAHARGIVHRDLKPSNLFRNHTPDGASAVKVLDFGISKSMFGANGDRNVVNTMTVWGSPLYMAPEQVLSSKQVGPWTDIWSLGVILYELLTGQLPFQADSLVDVCDAIVSGPHRPLASVRPELPEAFCAVVERCLQKDPAARWPDVGALAAALVSFATPRAAEHAQRVLHLTSTEPGCVLSARRLLSVPAPPSEPNNASWATTRLLERRRRRGPAKAALACAAALAIGGVGAGAWSLLSHSRARLSGHLLPASQLPPASLSTERAAMAPPAERPARGEPSAAPEPSASAAPPAADAPSARPTSPPAPAAPAHAAAPQGGRPASRHAAPPAGEPAVGGHGVLRDLARDRK